MSYATYVSEWMKIKFKFKFKYMVLRGMSGAKWKEVAGGCRIVFNL